jgi:pyruvate/2-oxoglutarate/acetoin dehydrogenase E1 component
MCCPLRFCLQMTLREAINSAIDEEMERDPAVLVMGA